MTNKERDIQRKLRVLQHAEKIGNARKAGLKNAKSIPKSPANQTPAEIVEKV